MLKYPVIGGAKLYADHLYMVSDQHGFSKLNYEGKEDWYLEEYTDKNLLFDIRFENLFVVDSKGDLSVYDVTYGFRLSYVKGLNIVQFRLAYPFFIFRNEEGHVGALDFFSGQQLWLNEDETVQDIFPIGRTASLVALTDKDLIMFDVVSGKWKKSLELPVRGLTFVKHWNDGCILKGKDEFYYFDLHNEMIVMSDVVLQDHFSWIRQKEYVSVDLDRQVWGVFDGVSNKKRLDVSFSERVEHVFFQGRLMLALTDEFKGVVYDLISGKVLLDDLSVPKFDFDSYHLFFEKAGRLYIVLKDQFIVVRK